MLAASCSSYDDVRLLTTLADQKVVWQMRGKLIRTILRKKKRGYFGHIWKPWRFCAMTSESWIVAEQFQRGRCSAFLLVPGTRSSREEVADPDSFYLNKTLTWLLQHLECLDGLMIWRANSCWLFSYLVHWSFVFGGCSSGLLW